MSHSIALAENRKACPRCHRELPTSCFSADKNKKFGVNSVCRECANEWKRLNPSKLLPAQYARRANNPDYDRKRVAWNKVYYALRTGKISKPNCCAVCGTEGRIQAHHADYGEPFEITWCCQNCHVKLDTQRRQSEEE